MSIETLDSEIARLREEFRELNEQHFRKCRRYFALTPTKEARLCQLADELHRMHFTRSFLMAEAAARP